MRLVHITMSSLGPVLVSLALLSFIPLGISVGTTPHLKEIFVGRCWEFQTLTRPELFTDGLKDCNRLWTLFSGAFMYKHPCNLTEEDFREYVSEAAHPFPKDTAILWDEVYPFTYKYSDHGARATALADYLPGHIAQEIVYCGSEDPPGINYDYCPPYMSCPGEVRYNFWKELSNEFSSKIEGSVIAVLNGSIESKVAYQNGTIFADRELVNILHPRATELVIWLVHDIGKQKTESCGEGSLKILEAIAHSQGLTYSCIDDPPETMHLQCVSHPNAPECQLAPSGGCNVPAATYSFVLTFLPLLVKSLP